MDEIKEITIKKMVEHLMDDYNAIVKLKKEIKEEFKNNDTNLYNEGYLKGLDCDTFYLTLLKNRIQDLAKFLKE